MTLDKFNFFKNVNYLLIGGHGEKLKKVTKLGRSASYKGSINLYKTNDMYTGPPPPETFPRMLGKPEIETL